MCVCYAQELVSNKCWVVVCCVIINCLCKRFAWGVNTIRSQILVCFLRWKNMHGENSVFVPIFLCKISWKVEPWTRLKYHGVEKRKKKKKNITTSKEGLVAITRAPLSFFLVLFFFFFFFSPIFFPFISRYSNNGGIQNHHRYCP